MATITFRVNLEAPLRNEHAPVSTLRTEGDQLKNTRTATIPYGTLKNRKLEHGDEFTVSGGEAKYLKDNYTVGDYAILTIVSEGMTFSEYGEVV